MPLGEPKRAAGAQGASSGPCLARSSARQQGSHRLLGGVLEASLAVAVTLYLTCSILLTRGKSSVPGESLNPNRCK